MLQPIAVRKENNNENSTFYLQMKIFLLMAIKKKRQHSINHSLLKLL